MLRRSGMLMVLSKALGAFFGRERLASAGVAAIELALVSPILFVGVVGTGELGISIFRQTQVGFAAQAGVDYAVAHGFNPNNPADMTNMKNAIKNATNYGGVTASPDPKTFCGCATATGVTDLGTTPPCSGTPCSGLMPGTYVQANSQATFNPIIPNPWQTGPVTLKAKAFTRIQ